MVNTEDDKTNGIELKTLSQVIEEDEAENALSTIPMDEFEEDTEKLLLSSATTMPSNGRSIGLCEFLCAYISLFLINKPKQSAIIVCTLLIGLAIVVNVTLENDKQLFSLDDVIETDYSSVQSKYDLTMGRIDHWCLTGGDKNCNCEDPTVPISKMQYKFWKQTHQLNLGLIDDYLSNIETNLDVVFIGENIVESWAGRSIGISTTGMKPMEKLFKSYFNKEGGSDSTTDANSDVFVGGAGTPKSGGDGKTKIGNKFNGLPLGIAGDTAPNVLWRILHGELPYYLKPQVFWIVLGTNDLAIKQCSEEVVLLGILRVIEEIQAERPDAKIVVNSIIPMTDDIKGRVPDIIGGNNKHRDRTRILQETDEGDDIFQLDDMNTATLTLTEYGDDYYYGDRYDDDDVLRGDYYEDDDGIFQSFTDDYDVSVPEVTEEEEMKEEQKIINYRPSPPIKDANVKSRHDHIPTVNIRQPFHRIPVAMWPSVVAVNTQLKKFCSKHKHITFFDSYDIFVNPGTDENNHIPRLKKEYYTGSFYTGMPSAEGNKALLKAISNRLNVMLNKKGNK